MLRWKVWEDDPPRQVECEQHGWPHEDAEGDGQYENTHFDKPEEAWKRALSEARAWVRMEASDIRQYEEKLARARSQLAKAERALVQMRTAAAEAGYPDNEDQSC